MVTRRARRKRLEAVGQHSLRAVWFVVVPALLTGIAFRYFVPSALDARFVSELRAEHPFVLAALVFVVFAGILRYWRLYLPGGKYLATIPASQAARLSRTAVVDYERALALRAWLELPSARAAIEKRLEPDARTDLAARIEHLDRLVEAGKNVDGARSALFKLVAPEWGQRSQRRFRALTAGVAVALAFAGALRGTVAQFYRVDGDSMLPSLISGDWVIGNRMDRNPARGELVVVKKKLGSKEVTLIKRVIGLPGDRISMRGNYLEINGWRVPSCNVGTYVHYRPFGAHLTAIATMEFLGGKAYLVAYGLDLPEFDGYEVKPGEIFVLGDNRPQSSDSRTWNRGSPSGVSLADVLARPEAVLGSPFRETGLELGRLSEALDLRLPRPGNMNLDALEGKIQDCLTNPPQETEPPQHSALAVAP